MVTKSDYQNYLLEVLSLSTFETGIVKITILVIALNGKVSDVSIL